MGDCIPHTFVVHLPMKIMNEQSESEKLAWISFNKAMNEEALLDAHYEYANLIEEIEKSQKKSKEKE